MHEEGKNKKARDDHNHMERVFAERERLSNSRKKGRATQRKRLNLKKDDVLSEDKDVYKLRLGQM